MDQENITDDNNPRSTGKGGKGRLYSFLFLIIVGVILVVYGSWRTLSPLGSEQNTDQPALSEMELNQEIAVGGLKRTKTGEIEKKTYPKDEKPPQACPT